MKKIVIILVTIVCLGFNINAQTCKIKNGGNSSVEVTSCYIDDNKIKVTVENDSNDISANITVTVTVVYIYLNFPAKEKEYTIKKRAAANSETAMETTFDKTYPGDKSFVATSVKVKSITGEKCE